MSKRWTTVLISILAVAEIDSANADVYRDDLQRCVRDSLSQADRVLMLRSIYAQNSLHPAVASMTKVTPADVERLNAAVGALITKTFTVTCVVQAKKLAQSEGFVSLMMVSTVFGEVASAELYNNERVRMATAAIDRHINIEKLKALAK